MWVRCNKFLKCFKKLLIVRHHMGNVLFIINFTFKFTLSFGGIWTFTEINYLHFDTQIMNPWSSKHSRHWSFSSSQPLESVILLRGSQWQLRLSSWIHHPRNTLTRVRVFLDPPVKSVKISSRTLYCRSMRRQLLRAPIAENWKSISQSPITRQVSATHFKYDCDG